MIRFLFYLMACTILVTPQIPYLHAETRLVTKRQLYDEAADGNKQVSDALIKAKEEGKNVLLQFGANWCTWCYRLHDLFENNQEVAAHLNENYVVVLIDLNKGHNSDINARYGRPMRLGLPAIVILDAEGKELTKKNTAELEEGKTYNVASVLAFLKEWQPKNEYRVKGRVTSFLYDADGKQITKELAPDVPPTTICDFVWHRKDEKWRLDIKQPNPTYPNGVWTTIMPLSETELISILSYPGQTNDSKKQGNAFVTTMTTRLLPAQHMYGAHAVWFTFTSDEILRLIGPSKQCPPFWSYDPSIHDLPVKSHSIVQTNGTYIFWNPGSFFVRDKQNLVFEEGKPKMVKHAPPLDKGFKEADFLPSPEIVNKSRNIPKQAEMTYWLPYKDPTNPTGFRMQMVSKLVVQNESVETVTIPESTFSPSWTNELATVVDRRERIGDKPLLYMTRSKMLNPSPEALNRKKKEQERTPALVR